MRVRPVASTGTTRRTRRDMSLGGHFVPRGTLVIVPFDAVHHHPSNWADPDAFQPVCGAPAACLHALPWLLINAMFQP
jgi:cytochrome P450